ncbi:LysR family transcriptional regulator [Ideonella sp. A 288]|uniref:LysR family transcriptional regulator n=1 Tax=Ideonella sp. A 288 TaxID=1962181 RepID=UPI000B4BFE38|nr:LysR family transcriptional regulator [Ideonella sp. A 288]
MDLPSLHAYVKVVQTGSFTRAAESLHTHKAHLSRVVSQLERELGVRLLERTTRSLSLTEAGREFFERAQGILAAVDDARLVMQQAQGEPRGTLRLTCGVEFGMLAVGRWINRYLQAYPKVKVDAEITGRIVDLVHEGFDLAIRVGPLPDSTLAARRLGSLAYALYAAPGYLTSRPAPRSPQDLSDHELLVFAGSSRRSAWQLGKGAESHRVSLNPRLHASNTFTIRDAAEQGLGIACLPCLVGAPLVADGRLRVVLKDWRPPEVPVHAVFASARFMAPKVRAFVDLAVEMFQPAASVRTRRDGAAG